jgi:pyrroline-5-carboxylate reductase
LDKKCAILGAGNIGLAIAKVTTPRWCTISGLNQMEHEGFSSAMIRDIITSAEKASGLYERRQ